MTKKIRITAPVLRTKERLHRRVASCSGQTDLHRTTKPIEGRPRTWTSINPYYCIRSAVTINRGPSAATSGFKSGYARQPELGFHSIPIMLPEAAPKAWPTLYSGINCPSRHILQRHNKPVLGVAPSFDRAATPRFIRLVRAGGRVGDDHRRGL
jgi:hypothetical protein